MTVGWLCIGVPVFCVISSDRRHLSGSLAGGAKSAFCCFDSQKVCSSSYRDSLLTPVMARLLKQQGGNLASPHFHSTRNESHTGGQLDALAPAGLCKVKCHWILLRYLKGQDDPRLVNRPACHAWIFFFFFMLSGVHGQQGSAWCKLALNQDLLLVWSCFIQQQLLYLAFQCILNMASCQGGKA